MESSTHLGGEFFPHEREGGRGEKGKNALSSLSKRATQGESFGPFVLSKKKEGKG